MKLLTIISICLIACISTSEAWNGFTSVVTKLTNFQTPSGGFRGTNGKPSIEATSNALLLASLYNLQSKVNTTEAANFITSAENSDGGYGPAPGSASDIESVKYALQGLQHVGRKPTNPASVLNYIKSLLDKNNLFAVRSGEKGTIKGTALALQSLEAIGELNQKWVQDVLPKIRDILVKHRQSGEVMYFSFPEEKETSQITANYYGIVVGNYVGFDFGTASNWAKYITRLQSSTGQFYDTVEKKATSLASTSHALLSLSSLTDLKGNTERFVDSINVDTLKSGVRHIASDITAAAHAHSAVALTKAFRDFFNAVISHDSDSNDYILEGSNYKPSVALSAIFDDNSAHPHGGFDVSTSTTFHGKDATQGRLTWDQELQRYVGEHLPTLGNLGPVKTAFSLVHKVVGLGKLSFDLTDLKNVGYGLIVFPKVSEDGGKEIREGETVSVGTDFKFSVALSTHSNENLLSGEFDVTFLVLDSSNVVIHQEKVSGATNKAPISFSYKLTSNPIPAGQLSFRFDVSGKGVAHTTRTLKYNYAVTLVASNIVFSGITKGQAPNYKLGDNVKVTIEPAVFPDLRNAYPLATKDANGVDIVDSRKFVLDVKSPQGVLLRSVSSAASKGSPKYTFEFVVEPVLESIGTNVLSFRYLPVVGDEVLLQNYDSSIGELYEDIQVLNYTVKADLSLSDLSQAHKAGNLFYGGNVGYKFRVKDAISGHNVYLGEKALANVFLDLQHEDDGSRPYTSLHHPATVSGEGKNKFFNIDWIINPNAISGSGSLALTILDSDGNAIVVKDTKSTKVDIGGDITVEPHTYATSVLTSRHSALIAEFILTCRNVTLKDADLLVNVVRTTAEGDQVAATLPVAHHNGRYTVSWTAPHKQIPSSEYKFYFFRNVDRTRAQEKKEQREKRQRKERELRGETTSTVTDDEVTLLKPLFIIDVSYSAPKFVSLPVRSEFLALISLGGFLGWLSYKKSNLK